MDECESSSLFPLCLMADGCFRSQQRATISQPRFLTPCLSAAMWRAQVEPQQREATVTHAASSPGGGGRGITEEGAALGQQGGEEADYSSMLKADLQGILRERGLKVSGTKAELIQRLQMSKADLQGILRERGLKVTGTKVELIQRLQKEPVAAAAAALAPAARSAGRGSAEQGAARRGGGGGGLVADYSTMLKTGLQGILRDRGLKVSGTKAELIQRLQEVRAPASAAGLLSWLFCCVLFCYILFCCVLLCVFSISFLSTIFFTCTNCGGHFSSCYCARFPFPFSRRFSAHGTSCGRSHPREVLRCATAGRVGAHLTVVVRDAGFAVPVTKRLVLLLLLLCSRVALIP